MQWTLCEQFVIIRCDHGKLSVSTFLSSLMWRDMIICFEQWTAQVIRNTCMLRWMQRNWQWQATFGTMNQCVDSQKADELRWKRNAAPVRCVWSWEIFSACYNDFQGSVQLPPTTSACNLRPRCGVHRRRAFNETWLEQLVLRPLLSRSAARRTRGDETDEKKAEGGFWKGLPAISPSKFFLLFAPFHPSQLHR